MRCDINLSVQKGSQLNTKTEIKNLNSFAFAGRAIEYEFKDVEKLARLIAHETRF